MTGHEGLDIGPRHAAPRERAAPGEREDVFALGRLSQNGYGCESEGDGAGDCNGGGQRSLQ